MLRQPLTYWLPKHPVFSFTLTLTQSVKLPMVTHPSLCSPYVTYGTLCHAIGHQVLPTHPGCASHPDVTYRTLCHAIGHQVLPTPAFSIIPHPSVSYRQVFRPILYIQPSTLQSDSRLYPNPQLYFLPRSHPNQVPSRLQPIPTLT